MLGGRFCFCFCFCFLFCFCFGYLAHLFVGLVFLFVPASLPPPPFSASGATLLLHHDGAGRAGPHPGEGRRDRRPGWGDDAFVHSRRWEARFAACLQIRGWKVAWL